MKCNISFSLIIISCYIFLVIDDINRLSKDKFVLGIYLLFYTFVLFYTLTYIFFDKD